MKDNKRTKSWILKGGNSAVKDAKSLLPLSNSPSRPVSMPALIKHAEIGKNFLVHASGTLATEVRGFWLANHNPAAHPKNNREQALLKRMGGSLPSARVKVEYGGAIAVAGVSPDMCQIISEKIDEYLLKSKNERFRKSIASLKKPVFEEQTEKAKDFFRKAVYR
ncbi:hypothetical protein [uncultured Flavobacterium sp.]|uniref:hypothetical protein n=1 Tax=uncultured Flavobacterium sp. TaxID=165435 RepID=UPI0025E659C0|nr:hypothetical protein [uncultured Flavobacterium sp.]